jgi:hypothetical protein
MRRKALVWNWSMAMTKPDQTAVLRVSFDGRDIAVAYADQLPEELHPNISWSGRPGPLTMMDGRGGGTAFDLDVVPAGEASCAALSIRVSESGVVQADCLLGKEALPTVDDFRAGALGLRFQPFFLPDFGTDVPDLRGLGLFDRGLHFSGTITPGNLSMLCLCDACRATFRLQSFHAGFSQLGYFYCGRGTHTLAVPSGVPGSPAALSTPDPQLLADLEARLPPCAECRENFAYLNPLRCPRCSAPFIDFPARPEIRPREYYGNLFYGHVLQRFEPS